MNLIPHDNPLAISVSASIKTGDVVQLKQQLDENPQLDQSCIIDQDEGAKRSLLHLATDWPGHFPNVGDTIRLLIACGAPVNEGIKGPNTETPLHWAASSNDVVAIDA